MDTFLIKAVQLIMALSLLVIIHEFGHFFFARIFGVKVEKFYIFFNPVTSLFKWKPKKYAGSLGRIRYFSEDAKTSREADAALAEAEGEYENAAETLKKAENVVKKLGKKATPEERENAEKTLSEAQAAMGKAETKLASHLKVRMASDNADYEEQKKESRWKRFWGHTEYGIGWVPLGGYCKLGGMIDESMDTAQMKLEPQEWEFRSKPAWQRLLIMIAGVLFNFLLAIVIYAGIVYATGEKYVPFNEAKMGMDYSPAAQAIGFRDGDIPLSADGKPLDNPGEARMEMAQASSVKVLRGGKDTVEIAIPSDFIFRLDQEAKNDSIPVKFMTYRFPAQVTQVMPGEGASKAGLESGDRIIAIDSVPTPTLFSFLTTLSEHPGESVTLKIARGPEHTDTVSKEVQLSDNAKMGIGLEIDPSAFYKASEINYNLFQSVPRGIEMGTDKMVSYARSMKLVFTKEGAKSVGGFGSIGAIFPEKWDWIAFWNIAAFLSVALAFMNILPIPALDGGHVLFLLYEVVTGRKPSEKFMTNAQMFGMILLLLLLLYANGMDIVRLFIK